MPAWHGTPTRLLSSSADLLKRLTPLQVDRNPFVTLLGGAVLGGAVLGGAVLGGAVVAWTDYTMVVHEPLPTTWFEGHPTAEQVAKP